MYHKDLEVNQELYQIMVDLTKRQKEKNKKYRNALPIPIYVGWLDKEHEFNRFIEINGKLSKVIDRLIELAQQPTTLTCGWHDCTFCIPSTLTRQQKKTRGYFDNGEIHVKGRANKVYTAPVMIAHYMLDHKYLPPAEFIDAVLEGLSVEKRKVSLVSSMMKIEGLDSN